MNTFLQCPRRYYYDYKSGIQKTIVPGSPLEKGLDIHEVFEWYYKQPEALEIKPPYADGVMSLINQHPKALKYPSFMENFAKFNDDFATAYGVPNYIPKEIELDLFDKNLNFRGIIDAVFELGNKRLLVDYKTGKPRAIREYMIELTLYKILYESVQKKPITHCGIYYPLTNKLSVVTVVPPGTPRPKKIACMTLEDEAAALELLEDVRKRIEFCDNDFESYIPDPGFLCNYCDHRVVCDLDGFERI